MILKLIGMRYRSFSELLNHQEQRTMYDYLFKLAPEEQERVIKKVRKLTGNLSNIGGESLLAHSH